MQAGMQAGMQADSAGLPLPLSPARTCPGTLQSCAQTPAGGPGCRPCGGSSGKAGQQRHAAGQISAPAVQCRPATTAPVCMLLPLLPWCCLPASHPVARLCKQGQRRKGSLTWRW